eukprot:Gregarina_sp_Poly_1__4532@NODE_2432_length_2144_cov_83_165623_g1546_i0_p1_GENE_NODE_2432_length_2144_cov_83_165623_g1546_i0NODE_2432_length_2144_cov_83_165623_g1546_i0_p1_ORF_typecomplete_len149_score2_66NUC153/PF08159_12/28NUC153/PF08159_12/17_NODE_2432_length_2144_cov_83_165623_g1546_i0461907
MMAILLRNSSNPNFALDSALPKLICYLQCRQRNSSAFHHSEFFVCFFLFRKDIYCRNPICSPDSCEALISSLIACSRDLGEAFRSGAIETDLKSRVDDSKSRLDPTQQKFQKINHKLILIDSLIYLLTLYIRTLSHAFVRCNKILDSV